MVGHPNVLIAEALLLAVAATFAGGVVTRLRVLIVGVAGFIALSLAAHLAAAASTSAAFAPTLAAHVMMAATSIGLAGLGRAARTYLRDPLDALALSLTAAAAATVWVFAIGDLAIRLPSGVVNTALGASPLVAVAWAGNIDLIRSPLIYETSPVAHREFAYPVWWTAAIAHATVGVTAMGAAALGRSRDALFPSPIRGRA